MTEPTLRLVDISSLGFDPENPRLPDRLKSAPDAEIIEFMIEEANISELMLSIAENGYFWGEPLLVVPSGHNANFIVVEGNRRLTSLKLLASNDPAPSSVVTINAIRSQARFRPTTVPVLVFEARKDILAYLGYRHITGIKEWDALAKAKYLLQLRQTLNMDDASAHKALAKQIGSKSSTVAKMLAGLKLLDTAEVNGILKNIKLKKEDIPFSLLTTGIGWDSVASFVGLSSPGDVSQEGVNLDHLAEFFSWTFFKYDGVKTRLGESRNFSKLARIVASPPALAALRRGDSIVSADTLTSGPLDAVRTNIQAAINAISNAQSALKYRPELSPTDVDYAYELEAQATSLRGGITAQVENLEAEGRRSSISRKPSETATRDEE